MAGLLAAVAAILLALDASGVSAADQKTIRYAIVIGQNEVPASRLIAPGEGLVRLRYADDDAAAFYSFIRHASDRAFLLTVLDSDTQRRLPGLVAEARPPTRRELDATIGAIKRAMEGDLANGRRPSLIFFYSGHGIRTADGAAALALLDEPLDQQGLYDRVLAPLPAKLVHVIVDACHAEALVRPRDIESHIEPLDSEVERTYLRQWSLARFPHVGVLLGSTRDEQSFEWDGYHGGVFTHEVISALSGGADVNGDDRIEYSEVAAFLAAANLRIADPLLHPHVIVQGPATDRRAPIIDLGELRDHFIVEGRASGQWAAPFFVENDAGARLVDLHPDVGSTIAIHLPAGQLLVFVRSDGEAVVTGSAGARVSLSDLPITGRRTAARGSAALALQRGLFAAAFGTGFYEGYLSQRTDLIPVSPTRPSLLIAPSSEPREDGHRKLAGWASLVGAAASVVGVVVYGGLSLYARNQYQNTDLEREAAAARTRFDQYSLRAGVAGALAAGFSLAGLWLISSSAGGARGKNGAAAE